MKTLRLRDRFLLQEDLNFLLTNRVPRLALTRFMGWYSRIRSPWLTRWSIAVWRLFTDLDLSEAKHQRFDSLRDCFIRELREGARPFDPRATVLASPCDAIVGAMGTVQQGTVLQAKGFPYTLADLMGSAELAREHEGCPYVTLRLTSSMYHRFHAPQALRIARVTYISGDTWNVNPIALKRIERLFCRNERAVIECRLADAARLTLVPVAAILVASIRLHCLPSPVPLREQGANVMDCPTHVQKGDELGWFEHGSTLIVFGPPDAGWAPGVAGGQGIQAGQALFERRPPAPAHAS